MLNDFPFGKLPVRHRRDRHRIGALVLCILRTPGRLHGRQIGNPDHDRHPAVDRRDRGIDDCVELRLVQIGQLAGAAERGDSAYFDASISRSFRSVGTAAAEVVVVADNDPNGYRR